MTSVEQMNEKKLPSYWQAPRKPSFREDLLDEKEMKIALLAHSKQQQLDRVETEKFNNSFKKQLCINMLIEGFHKSFREIDIILKLQIEERHRVGSEHPVWNRPLLDCENVKLEYLCKKLNLAETSERLGNYKSVCLYYQDIAIYFLLTDDSWLSDYFFEKSLNIAVDNNLSSELLAEGHCNMALAYERQTSDYTAKSDRLRGSFFKAMYHFEQYYNLTKSTDWHTRQKFEDFSRDDLERLENIRRQDVEAEFKEFYNSEMFTQACLHLQRIYKTISNRYANEHEEKIEYLTKTYEVCKSSPIRIMEGLTSYLLGNAYTECSKLDVALACYNNYYDISKRSKNLENFGRASEAVAKCYEKMGQVEKSIEYLEKYLKEVSNKEADEQYSKTCNCLANIYNSKGLYDTAFDYAKKAFEISNQIKHRETIELNRVLYGITKAHKHLKKFNENIESATRNSIKNLIEWKYKPEHEEILYANNQDSDNESSD